MFFFFKLKIQTYLIIDPVIIEKQHFKPYVVTCLQIHFFFKKGKKGKKEGAGGGERLQILKVIVSYYFIQSAHTRCSKHALSSR